LGNSTYKGDFVQWGKEYVKIPGYPEKYVVPEMPFYG